MLNNHLKIRKKIHWTPKIEEAFKLNEKQITETSLLYIQGYISTRFNNRCIEYKNRERLEHFSWRIKTIQIFLKKITRARYNI